MDEVVVSKQSHQNPFISIWIRPRGTIRQIVNNDPKKYVLILAFISGIYQALDRATKLTLGDSMSLLAIILFCLVVGGFLGILSLYIGGALFSWSGGLLGGVADSRNIRAALAWSSVPDIVLLIMILPIIAIFGLDWFKSAPFPEPSESMYLLAFVLVAIPGFIIVVWKAFILIKCIAEVHGFSSWRGLASVIIGFLFIVIPILIMILIGLYLPPIS